MDTRDCANEEITSGFSDTTIFFLTDMLDVCYNTLSLPIKEGTQQ